MTPIERQIADRLKQVVPANFKEDKFIQQLTSWHNRDMTEMGRAYLLRLLDRYSKDIPDAEELKKKHLDEQLGNIG